jgi:hypothetical protein
MILRHTQSDAPTLTCKWGAVMQGEPTIVVEVFQNIGLEHGTDQSSF